MSTVAISANSLNPVYEPGVGKHRSLGFPVNSSKVLIPFMNRAWGNVVGGAMYWNNGS